MNSEPIRLVQIEHHTLGRRIARVKESLLLLLSTYSSVYELVLDALDKGASLNSLIATNLSDEWLDYDSVYGDTSDWKLLPAFDHPQNPFACLVSGTGLTHKNSALNRQMMHQSAENKPTDSMQMYQWGVEDGSPQEGSIGVQPEWFYKGNGSILRAHGQPLEIPVYGNDGGEEPEVAGIYIIGRTSEPVRIGFCTGNEFSDHVMEKKNYLYLAPSKLRQCSIGPELVINADFAELTGDVSIVRKGTSIWSSPVRSGEKNMAHNIANLEYHHFKYEAHRIPLQAHIHFFGADAFSFGANMRLEDGDIMEVRWDGLGRALQNPLKILRGEEKLIEIRQLN